MEEKTLLDIFADTVNAQLNKALVNAKANAKEGETVISASVACNISQVLKALGAGTVKMRMQVNEDLALLCIEATDKSGFFRQLPRISQRRQAKHEELDTIKSFGPDTVIEAYCIASITEVNDGEEIRIKRTIRWDELTLKSGDLFVLSGDLRL